MSDFKKDLPPDVLEDILASQYGNDLVQIIKEIHPLTTEIKKLLKKTSDSEQFMLCLYATLCYLLHPIPNKDMIKILEHQIDVLRLIKEKKR